MLDEAATKKNTKESAAPSRGGSGLDLETALAVQVRVRGASDPSYCWMDVHVFDGHDELIRSETLPLQFLRPADEGDGDIYAFDAKVYRGSGASPGSVWLAPDARRVQYRVYFETGGTVFSDGLLRQHELAPDSSVTHSAPAPAPARRRRPTAATEAAPTPAS
ncbi:MAG TPA: hypothetical protein VHT97_13090 [Acidimicrobiales bacterium]|nr:hypothetical protein [Acidimicrobiales bacterium]